MRQEKEQPRDKDLGINRDSKPSIDFSKFNIPGASLFDAPEAMLRFRGNDQENGLRETRLALRHEDRRGNREEQPLRKQNSEQKPDGFEPFFNQEFKEEDLFVNNYGGNYAHAMKLNRRGVERALKIAHLDGKVFLTNLQPNRSRAEVQGNELAAKRFLIFGEKPQEAEEENPYKRVVSVPEGWRIEINDTRITEELRDREKLTGRELQRTFVNRFNGQLKEALKECVWREKLTSEKYREYIGKLIVTLCGISAPILSGAGAAIHRTSSSYTAFSTSLGLGLLVFYISNSPVNSLKRSTDNIFEALLPPLEIDKVARTFAYLSGKGRTLVREAKE